MNTFKIYFKETTVLEIGGIKKTFKANMMYGFKFISDKELKSIRKQLIGKSTVNFQTTDDLLGCFQIVYGNKKPKDVSTTNLVTLNKGRKNKSNTKYASKSSIKDKLEEDNKIADKAIDEVNEVIVPPVEEEVTIADGIVDVNKEENNGNE